MNGVFFKINKTDNYTMMSNHHLKNKKLSLKAKGLMSILLSLPPNWDFSKSGLEKIVKEGRAALDSTLEELKAEGYLKIEETRDKGRFVYTYYIYEIPFSDPPHTENPYTVNQQQLNTNKLSTKELNTNISTNTNVLVEAKPKTYGNQSINNLFNKWEEIFGYKQKDSKQNRYAASNMLRAKDKGEQWLIQTMTLLYEAQKDKYAGNYILGISNFADLQQRYDAVWKWGSTKYARNQDANESIDI